MCLQIHLTGHTPCDHTYLSFTPCNNPTCPKAFASLVTDITEEEADWRCEGCRRRLKRGRKNSISNLAFEEYRGHNSWRSTPKDGELDNEWIEEDQRNDVRVVLVAVLITILGGFTILLLKDWIIWVIIEVGKIVESVKLK